MKPVIKQIDRALKKLYSLPSSFKAEDFLISQPMAATPSIGNPELKGALFIKPDDQELSLGIYLSPKISKELKKFYRWQKREWTRNQLEAFTVATEEVSHFQYLLYRAQHGESVSQFELELQGEVDKFVLSFFAGPEENKRLRFKTLMERLFVQFRLAESLSAHEKERYLEANHIARRYLKRLEPLFASPSFHAKALQDLRRFYHSSVTEKVSCGN